ncbi:hypothetical protein [Gloeomargarita sp.]
MSPAPLWQRVQQGETAAIATVIERLWPEHEVHVTVTRPGDHYRIAIQGNPLPPFHLLVKQIDQELCRYKLPRATPIQLCVHTGTNTWETDFLLGDTLQRIPMSNRRPKRSSAPLEIPLCTLDARAKNSLWIGAIVGLGLCWPSLSRFVLSYLVIIIHELGHTLAGWLMGYPSFPAFDFIHGGGITLQLQERWALIPVLIYSGLGGLLYYFRRNHLTVMVIISGALLYTGMYFTRVNQLFFLAMGHGCELLFIGIFLYRSMTGWGCQQPGEQTLYGVLGFFMWFYDLNFVRQLLFDPQMRALYALGKGEVLDHDWVRIAGEFLRVDLSLVVVLFGVSCLLTPLLTWGLYRYQNYWRYGCVQLLRRQAE